MCCLGRVVVTVGSLKKKQKCLFDIDSKVEYFLDSWKKKCPMALFTLPLDIIFIDLDYTALNIIRLSQLPNFNNHNLAELCKKRKNSRL